MNQASPRRQGVRERIGKYAQQAGFLIMAGDALRKIAGDKVANLVELKPEVDIQAYINSLPVRFITERKLRMDFVADKDLETIIRDYISDQGIQI